MIPNSHEKLNFEELINLITAEFALFDRNISQQI